MKKNEVSSFQDWPFFETAARAAFANPFSEVRDTLDLVMGEKASASSSEALNAAIARIEQRIGELRGKGVADLRSFTGDKRDIMQSVFLFHVFHRHTDGFDDLIKIQMKTGSQPCKVPFSRRALTELGELGFSEDEAVRYFSVFYQMRRAYYFIKNGLVGASPSMRVLRKHLWNCVFTHDVRVFEANLWNRMEDFSILLLGETGSGKGSAAAAIGRSGFIPFETDKNCFAESFMHNFIAINLSQYSEGVLESELFGHKKGAFTGAVENHEGLFGRCPHHGVIFLDEIGDIGTAVQIKLLQVLQERIFFPVGSHEAKHFGGRVIAATNKKIDDLRHNGVFRDDLYFRLCSDEIVIPSLRQRLQEDPHELDTLLSSIMLRLTGNAQSIELDRIKSIVVRDVGKDYSWPGNVRELEQAVKRIILTGRYQRPTADGKELNQIDRLMSTVVDIRVSAEELLAAYCRSLYNNLDNYEDVARITNLDRRTVKKYVNLA